MEPTYYYVKGQGWVPMPDGVETRVFEAFGYRVTLYARKPVAGERWFAEPRDRSIDETMSRLKEQNWRYSNGLGLGVEYYYLTEGQIHQHLLDKVHGVDVNWVTVYSEPLNG